MISKKNKALTAGILAAAMSASAIVPSFASAATEQSKETARGYAEWFGSLYDDVITNGQANGYLSKQNNGGDSFGIPYHAVETLVVEAPDYGHETTSEAMSYIAWVTAMRDVLGAQDTNELSATNDLPKAWKTVEAIIPGWSVASGRMNDINYKSIWQQQRLKSDTAPELDTADQYPTKNISTSYNDPTGDALNPLYQSFKSAYSSDPGYYLMHWLADVDDWYGFGGSRDGGSYNGNGKFTFINTFQRGREESCFETVPHPCIEERKYGNTQDGMKGIFNGVGTVSNQYAFTNAPDAEDRAIQAVYFANLYGAGDSSVTTLAGKMGDQLRNDMFDKYYKTIAKDTTIYTPSNTVTSPHMGQHYLRSWYTSWGGALDGSWAWQIGCSHSHEFYQNPLAAYALLTDKGLRDGMKSTGAVEDYKESLKRQIEMYLWLQCDEGMIGGGCTNSWNGRYEAYPEGISTFYDMAYVAHPVYADPGSNHWIGNQVWAIQRLAELYYYVKTQKGDKTTIAEINSSVKPGGLTIEEALKTILDKWITWMLDNIQYEYDADGTVLSYAMPTSLNWGEQPSSTSANGLDDITPNLDNQPATWTGTYSADANKDYHCTIAAMGRDIGCSSSLANILIYYAAANGVDPSSASDASASTTADKALYTANKILTCNWDEARDDIGLCYTETNGGLSRIFTEQVYIGGSSNNYVGKMPDGSELSGTKTFSEIRQSYNDDEMYSAVKKYYEENGTTDGFELNYHRFWHESDAIMAYGAMALLYPTVEPLAEEESDLKVTLWGDANVDGFVTISDAVVTLSYVSNSEKAPLTEQGILNADVFNNGDGLSTEDSLSIQKRLVNVLSELPESYMNK